MTFIPTKDTKLDGIVVYADGSCKPNPGFLGFGFHGYAYNKDEPKKGSGNQKYVLTNTGYVDKNLPKTPHVTPLCYFDSIGSTSQQASNNTAEILAATAAIDHAANFNVSKVLLKTDSNYVVKGVNDWSYHWVKNRWIKRDGTPVPNRVEWQGLLNSVTKLRETGTSLEVRWVESHSTHLGNILADKLADIGCEMSKTGRNQIHTTTTKSDGYWKPQEERAALLAYRSMFFSTLGSTFIKGEYYLGLACKSDEIIGNRDADGAYAVVQLKEPDAVLELIRTRQAELSGDIDTMVLARIDRIYNGTKADDLMRYGAHCLIPANKRTINLNFVTDRLTEEPLTEQLYPPMLSLRTMQAVAELKEILETFKDNDPVVFKQKQWDVIDITDHFFEIKEKKVGKEVRTYQELKSEFVSTMVKTSISTPVNGHLMRFDLTFGIDLIPRNNLKRLAEQNVKMSLVVIREGDAACRYHTVISSGEDWSIWSGFYTNMVLFPKNTTTETE